MQTIENFSTKEIRIQKALGLWPKTNVICCIFCGNNKVEELTVRTVTTFHSGHIGRDGRLTGVSKPLRFTCISGQPCSSGIKHETNI